MLPQADFVGSREAVVAFVVVTAFVVVMAFVVVTTFVVTGVVDDAADVADGVLDVVVDGAALFWIPVVHFTG